MMRDAPAALQMPDGEDADRPAAGDQHRRARDLGAVSAVWKALPIGSWMPPMS